MSGDVFSFNAIDGSLARLKDGSYLAVWATGNQIRGQIFAQDGSPFGADFSIMLGAAAVSDISVAALKDSTGRSVLAWMENGTIKSVILEADQKTQAEPVRTLDTDLMEAKTAPKVYTQDNGGYAIVYQGLRPLVEGETDREWYAARTMVPGSTEFLDVRLSPNNAEHASAVLTDSTGVLIYANFFGDLQVEGNQPLDLIDRTSPVLPAHHSVTALAGAKFVVTWQDILSEKNAVQVICAQVYGSKDHAREGDTLRFAKPPGTLLNTAVTELENGTLVLTLTVDEDGDKNIYVATHTVGGTFTEPVLVGTKAGAQTDPSVIALHDGTFVVGWSNQVEGQGLQFMTAVFTGTETPPANKAPTNVHLTTGDGSAATIAENSAAGSLVAKVTADDDGPSGELRYVMSDNAAFTIDEKTGEIRVKAGVKLDYETAQTYTVQVMAKDLDGTGLSSVAKTIAIQVSDVLDVVSGTSRKDMLKGASGADRLDGFSGNDTLTGGAGQDIFVFSSKLGSPKTDRSVNFDKITDFSVKDDAIWLDNKIFTKLGKGSEANPGKLNKGFLVTGDKSKDKNDYLIYNKKTGVLSYDADGSGTKYKAVEFAQLSNKPTLKDTDFFII